MMECTGHSLLLLIQPANHPIRQDNLNRPFCLLSDVVIDSSGAPAFSLYCVDGVGHVANESDALHHHLDCLSIVGVVGLFDQFDLHTGLHEVVAAAR